jgi:hypothetical protein
MAVRDQTARFERPDLRSGHLSVATGNNEKGAAVAAHLSIATEHDANGGRDRASSFARSALSATG